MNWDTKETLLWIENEEEHYTALAMTVGNELMFPHILFTVIININKEVGFENRIDSAKVNGNEVYVTFSKLIENEQEGWK